MYERSAIVLENCFNIVLGLDKNINLKTIYNDYKELVQKTKEYGILVDEEDEVISQFDQVATEIRSIQQEQSRLYRANIKLEEERNQVFIELDEDYEAVENRIKKIENEIQNNNSRNEELREEFVQAISKFNDKQKERNFCLRKRRDKEKEFLKIVDISRNDIDKIEKSFLNNLRKFIDAEDINYENEFKQQMINNGKGEKVPFNEEVISLSVRAKRQIEQQIAECYIISYNKIKRVLEDLANDNITIEKYEKIASHLSVRLSFLEAENNYIVNFLDYERMTAINGEKVHEQLMMDACNNFELDIEQFHNLYEIILREISGNATKKLYEELLNKTYLRDIEAKERKFENQINNINIQTGAFINSNYWRIQEIRNIYELFYNELTEKMGKDLSEYKIEEYNEFDEREEDDIFKEQIDFSKDDIEYVEEYDYNEDKTEKEKIEDNDIFTPYIDKKDQYREFNRYDENNYDEKFNYNEYEQEEETEFDQYEDEDNFDEKYQEFFNDKDEEEEEYEYDYEDEYVDDELDEDERLKFQHDYFDDDDDYEDIYNIENIYNEEDDDDFDINYKNKRRNEKNKDSSGFSRKNKIGKRAQEGQHKKGIFSKFFKDKNTLEDQFDDEEYDDYNDFDDYDDYKEEAL